MSPHAAQAPAAPDGALTSDPAAATALVAPTSEAIDSKELLPDLVRSLYGLAYAALGAHLLALAVLLVAFVGVASTPVLALWGLLFTLVWGLRLWAVRRYANTSHAERNRDAQRWLQVWGIGALAAAALWGGAAWMFYGEGRTVHQAVVLLVVYSFCVGAIPVLASYKLGFLLFTALCFGPLIVRVAAPGDRDSLGLALLLVLILGMVLILARTHRRVFERALSLKVRNERLAAQLKVEKRIADEARHVAETANRAKTQFFAAASHDLRQPLHAMGLFAEALRAQVGDNRGGGNAEVLHLVSSINASVDALEGLFGELLDITKIDTGGVDPRPEHFALRDLFQRLKLQYEPTAFEKGLALRFRGGHRHVHGDPVLVDRIVRNLLSNAIRYTQDGGVLVSARQRGDTVLVQVWDTGVGISATEQSRVFDEFYQVQAGAPLEAHQPKGLGLGLAIVQRLARLMNAPLALASQPGRGTVFTLSLPLGELPPPAPTPARGIGKPAIGLTLEHRLIVIVEDEPAVRDGLTLLLRSWGAEVLAFESVAAVEAWARTPGAPRPDLALVDYRLPGGRTGIDALQALRGPFAPQPVPAIVITGSTIGGHEDESSQHDFHLLVKPVAPNKLRAMVAFKLGLK